MQDFAFKTPYEGKAPACIMQHLAKRSKKARVDTLRPYPQTYQILFKYSMPVVVMTEISSIQKKKLIMGN